MAKEEKKTKSAADRAKEYQALARKILRDEKMKNINLVVDYLIENNLFDDLLTKALKRSERPLPQSKPSEPQKTQGHQI